MHLEGRHIILNLIVMNNLGFSMGWDDSKLKQSTGKKSIYKYEGLPK